ncbi:CDP-glycerol glycerophosphotransferase family protein, partial [Arcobacteraceae bacterium]|nr:CDP-glycerol glycerophosphotransferase family protein [Arcobacteraceae bacterium]
MNLFNKKIFIAPHTPKTTMLEKEITEYYDIEILGFIDKQKNKKNIEKIKNILNTEFDFILIYSPNHFDSIYHEYKKDIDRKKLIQIDIQDNKYIFNNHNTIFKNKLKKIYPLLKLNIFKKFVNTINFFNIKRSGIIFISKDFVGTNNKMLFLVLSQKTTDILMLTDNKIHLDQLLDNSFNVSFLGSMYSYFQLSKAKIVIQDQGNSNYLVKYLDTKQTKIQLWHGIPLKRMNQLVDVVYDYHISTSDFVNKTSLSQVIQASKHLDLGYPRNDLLLKEHTKQDLLFVNTKIYKLAQENTTIVYMPTHRESAPAIDKKINKTLPLNFEKMNDFMKSINSFFILKLHPFVSKLYKEKNYSNIIFFNPQDDIYPLLKYTDILITDYSSVYYDFLLLDRPIVFFDYDKEEYEKNIGGFTYNYDDVTPGEKAKTQEDLILTIKSILEGNDKFKNDRSKVKNKFFTYCDENSSQRICNKILDLK